MRQSHRPFSVTVRKSGISKLVQWDLTEVGDKWVFTICVFLLYHSKNMLLTKWQHVLLHQLSVSPPLLLYWCKITSELYFSDISKKMAKNLCFHTLSSSKNKYIYWFWYFCSELTGLMSHSFVLWIEIEAVTGLVVGYISAGNIRYSAEEELVLLCAHSWTYAWLVRQSPGVLPGLSSRTSLVCKNVMLNIPTLTTLPHKLIYTFAHV